MEDEEHSEPALENKPQIKISTSSPKLSLVPAYEKMEEDEDEEVAKKEPKKTEYDDSKDVKHVSVDDGDEITEIPVPEVVHPVVNLHEEDDHHVHEVHDVSQEIHDVTEDVHEVEQEDVHEITEEPEDILERLMSPVDDYRPETIHAYNDDDDVVFAGQSVEEAEREEEKFEDDSVAVVALEEEEHIVEDAPEDPPKEEEEDAVTEDGPQTENGWLKFVLVYFHECPNFKFFLRFRFFT